MNRRLKFTVLAALLLASSPAWALDLGQIQVKSALDQPLVAEIPLQPDHPGEAGHVQVRLASADAFARAGIDRSSLKVPLRFKVVTHDGKKFIRVTSAKPVREPYLDFLIRVSWPQGKMLREYTVLLDPLSAGSHPQPESAGAPAPTSASTTTSHETGSAETASTPPRSTATGSASGSPSGSYEVHHGDTLSQVARAHAIQGVGYMQMLIALKSANPDAFFKDNVNALKAGAVLRIPTRDQALAVSRTEAINRVHQQNRGWQQQHATKPTMVAAAGGSSAPVTGKGTGKHAGDHLALVPPSGNGSGQGSGGSGNDSASQLRQKLARSQEALSSQKQSAADLESRVAALEKLQDKNKRLLSLKNSQIAELQDKLDAARKQAGLPPSSATVATAAASSAANPSLASSVRMATTAGAASAAVADQTATAATAAAAAMAASGGTVAAVAGAADKQAGASGANGTRQTKPAPSAHHAPSQAANVPWYEQMWARIALGVIIVLLIIWALVRRRKPRATPRRGSIAHRFSDAPADAQADPPGDAEPVAGPIADVEDENELLAQLAEHPDNIELHLELVSLYYARGETDHFEAAAEAMHAHVGDSSEEEWQEVLAMGRELTPDHPLFADDSAPTRLPGHEAAETGENGFAQATHDDDATAVPGEYGVPPAGADEPVSPEGTDPYDFGVPPLAPEAEGGDQAAGGMPTESEFDELPPLPPEPAGPEAPEVSAVSAVDSEPSIDAPEWGLQASSDEATVGNDVGVNAVATDAATSEPGVDEPNPDDATVEPPTGEDEAPGASDDDAVDMEGFSGDPVDTKLDLARAYIDMGDSDGARAMLEEAVGEGTPEQQEAARKLLGELD